MGKIDNVQITYLSDLTCYHKQVTRKTGKRAGQTCHSYKYSFNAVFNNPIFNNKINKFILHVDHASRGVGKFEIAWLYGLFQTFNNMTAEQKENAIKDMALYNGYLKTGANNY